MSYRLTRLALVGTLLVAGAAPAAAQAPSKQQQMDLAVLPAPPERQADATILGYEDGRVVTWREGTNDYVCLADAPGDETFHAACYHASLEPFMARGRELAAEGKTREEITAMREEEALAGTLPMPEQAAMRYVADGAMENFDPATGEIADVRTRYVVYIPYATAETTGLPPKAPAGQPWIMDEGKPWAHIKVIPEQ